MAGKQLVLICILSMFHVAISGSAQITTTETPRIREMDKTHMILLNVAAKGRVVELLANELARTEIIRALLVEYAQECVQNVTSLEKSCLSCMMERCQNRIAECEIKIPPLREVITHDPSPIMGIQFLSQTSVYAENQLREFADKARSDILKDVPRGLRKEGENIMHSEVDHSLADLQDSMNTDKLVKDISVQVQKAANNVHLLPQLGEKVGTLIIDNEDRAVNIAEFLAHRLKNARPFLKSIGHNGGQVMDAMPTVIEEVGRKVANFKEKVLNIFGNALNTFQDVVNNPDTPVSNEAAQIQQQVSNQLRTIPNLVTFRSPIQFVAPNSNQFSQFPQTVNQGRTWVGASQAQLLQANANAQQLQQLMHQASLQNGMGLSNQGQQFTQSVQPQFVSNNAGFMGGGQMSQGMQIQGQGIPQGQFQNMGQVSQINQQFANQGIQFPQGQQSQNIGPQFQGPPPVGGQGQMVPNQGQQFQGQIAQNGQGQQVFPAPIAPQQVQQNVQTLPTQSIQQTQQGQGQGQSFQPSPLAQGRRKKRRADPDCKSLKSDPNTYCRRYESHCHNCTLEKRLRFEVCGDGVEKARDEIKRLDLSVQGYLTTYDDHVAGHPLILKVELNDKNRLHKTMSYYDAYITTKVGHSILRYKSKMILNINDIRTSGSQIGDELWETLWEHGVFKEAAHIVTSPDKTHDMGQLHNIKASAHVNKPEAHARTSTGSVVTSWTSLIGGLSLCIILFL